MKTAIIILAVGLIGFGCSAKTSGDSDKQEKSVQEKPVSEIQTYVYASSEGQIKLSRLTDSTYFTVFTNNEGFQMDTTLTVGKKEDYRRMLYISPRDSVENFLQYKKGALVVYENRIDVHDFTSIAQIALETQIRGIYDVPFYLTGAEITVKGDIYSGKVGHHVNGIHLGFEELPGSNSDSYYEVTGIVSKEAYPVEYYSTDESPQGMFDSDTSKKYYRLVMEDPEIQLPEKEYFKGTTINDSNGRAGIAWELADSELYLIWGKEEGWPENELGKDIGVNAVYVYENGISWLKNVEYLH